MPRRIIFRRQIPDDLIVVVSYLKQYHPAVADRFVDQVFAALDDLAVMPGIGSPKGFKSPQLIGIRSWSVPEFRNYLIFYTSSDEAIIVLAIVHGARNVRQLLLDRLT